MLSFSSLSLLAGPGHCSHQFPSVVPHLQASMCYSAEPRGPVSAYCSVAKSHTVLDTATPGKHNPPCQSEPIPLVSRNKNPMAWGVECCNACCGCSAHPLGLWHSTNSTFPPFFATLQPKDVEQLRATCDITVSTRDKRLLVEKSALVMLS